METKTYAKWLYRLSIGLLCAVFLYILFLLKPVWHPILDILMLSLLPFLIGGFIAYLLHPLVEKIHEAGIHRGIAIMFIYILFFGGLGYALYKGTPIIIHQLRDLSENAPLFTSQYQKWLHYIQSETSTWPDGIQTQLDDRIDGIEGWLTGLVAGALAVLLKLMNSLLLIAIIPFVSFYLLKDITKVKKFFWELTPVRWRQSALRFSQDVDESLGGYIRGQLLVCLIIGGISAAVLWFLGMKYPLILGVIMGATNVIPYFGPIIGAVPAVIVASTISLNMILYVVILVLVLQFLEGNILSPMIVGKSLHMHPLFIMGALIIGGETGGVIGMIVAVPVLAVIKVAVLHGRTHFVHTKN
ncbi:AI-2E family transporter [Bacillus haikouensis]|jgi:predicted PurR-regulated permease PerM|uniref:AI-2E family transporter n=1 Tax=Bacillus haikouensis TaxID=1510468 RepID=UPI0015527FF1|nr:AI-2E family transporter [Bacillus haikouensis]NQD68865.1 AI-2E family transporter [Bacillus haikouensis]